jgi:hypothetical protein
MHRHEMEPARMVCAGCGATAEQIYRGEAHPGRSTSERIWELVMRLAGRRA